ncbi:helix-turn-helix domain-containing protein [Floccifex sp.]|uniref:helix-turn-helix domain-containing protein n=1 Tax=Floccifex sp. TaxID=2815810 RepID=UPI003F0CED4E
MRIKREEIVKLMEDVYTAKEAAEYLNISTQRPNQLVHENRITPIKATKSVTLFLKEDLDNRGISNFSNKSNLDNGLFDIDTTLVRDAILYYTIQQYFNNNDKRTTKFIEELISIYGFDYRADYKEIFLF